MQNKMQQQQGSRDGHRDPEMKATLQKPFRVSSGEQPANYYRGFFISIFFISIFYKNIFSIWKFTEIYPGHPTAGRQGFIRKKKEKKLQIGPWGQSPGCGAAGPPGRPAAGRPALPPYIRVSWSPHPSFASLQFQKKEKRGREGERRSTAGFSSRRLQVTKILLRFTNSMIVCPDMSSNYFCCNFFVETVNQQLI